MARLIAAIICSLLLSALDASASEVWREKGIVFLHGKIDDGDASRVISLLPKKNPVLAMESMGGSFMEGIRIGIAVRKHLVGTVSVGDCASACALAWAAGVPPMMVGGSRILFHSPFDSRDGEANAGGAAVAGQYLSLLGYGSDFIFDAFRDNLRARGFGYEDVFIVNKIYGTHFERLGKE